MSQEEFHFVRELKRRRVFRVIGMYAVTSFVLLQVGDVAFEPLGLPAGSQRLLIVLLALGFPLVTVLAWIFDLTPDGIIRTAQAEDREVAEQEQAAGGPFFGSFFGSMVDRTVIVLLVGVIILLVWDPELPWDSSSSLNNTSVKTVSVQNDAVNENSLGESENAATADVSGVVPAGSSVAVLKFSSLSPAAEDAYFAAGMTAEIQSVLARIPDIRTVSVSVSERTRRADDDKQSLGVRLGAAYLLEGSVRKAGADVRVMVQLVRSSDGRLVWSETYQRKVDDVFAIQDAIAEVVAIRLQSTLYREGIRARARSRTNDPEAYNYYLTALYYRPTANWELVAENARRAIDADPEFASARALLARAYLTRLGGQIPAAQAYPAARAEVEVALALDPTDPETLLMMGHLERAAGDYRRAESIYRNVKAITPNQVTTDLANLLQLVGRLEESLEEYEYSRRLDPGAGTTFYGMALVSAGRIEDASDWVDQNLTLLEEGADDAYLRCYRALLLALSGDYARIELLDELDGLESRLPADAFAVRGHLIYALARSGRVDEAERIFLELEKRAQRDYVSPVAFVFGAMGLGDSERFFFWLNRAIDERVLLVTSLLKLSLFMDPFRTDPRYDAALDRLNLAADVEFSLPLL